MINKTLICLLIVLGIPTISLSDSKDYYKIPEYIEEWQTAWQNKDIDLYISFYSRLFESDGLNYNRYKNKKRLLFKKPGPVSVNLSELCLEKFGDRIKTTFLQHYTSQSISDKGKKTLIWEKKDNQWKIISEKWARLTGDSTLPEPNEFSGSIINIFAIKGVVDYEGMEKVLIKLNRPAVPGIDYKEGESPFIVMDFPNVSTWNNSILKNKDCKMINSIHAFRYGDCLTLRIILSMNPLFSYDVTPIYYKADKIFGLEILENNDI